MTKAVTVVKKNDTIKTNCTAAVLKTY